MFGVYICAFFCVTVATVGWSCVFLSIHVVVQCAAVVIREIFLGEPSHSPPFLVAISLQHAHIMCFQIASNIVY